MTRPTHLGLAVATLALLSFGTVPASAYQRTMTCGTDTTGECKKGEKAKPLWWPVHCLTYRINERGTDQFPRTKDGEIGGQLRDLVKRGFRAWSNPDCSELQIESRGLTPNDRVRYRQCKGWQENENVVVWRDDGWPHTSTATIALTSVHYDLDDGRILDADIEFNTSFYDFTNLDEPGEKNKIDFLNTHTHEVGHFVGLDHPGDHPEATMHAQARAGEIKKRTLEHDDVAGLCSVYEYEGEPTRCEKTCDFDPNLTCDGTQNGGGCGRCDVPSDRRAPPVELLVAALMLVGGRRAYRAVGR